MNAQYRNILIGIAGLVVLALLGYLGWKERVQTPMPTAASSTPSSATTTHSTSSGQASSSGATTKGTNVGVTGTGKFTITPVVATPPADLKTLIALGNGRKHAGDYAGAAKAWQQASALYPTNVVSFNNLGDLYMNFLPNYPLSEANYLKQIVNRPGDVNAYRALFDLYTYHYRQGTGAAEDILKKGIAANPKAYDLQVLLARYYRSLGRTGDANAQYEAAIASANAQGMTALAAQIKQEEAGQ